MTAVTGDRRGAVWGLGFVAFLAAALATLVATGDETGTRQEIVSHYERRAGELILVGMLIGAAGFCLLPFLGTLRSMLRRVAPERDGLVSVAFGGGLVFTSMLFAFGAAASAVGTTSDWMGGTDGTFRVDADTAQVFELLAFWFASYAGAAGGVMTGAASILAWRTGVLPRWLAVLGIVFAVAGFATMLTWGLAPLAVSLWILLACLVILVRSRTATKQALAAPASR